MMLKDCVLLPAKGTQMQFFTPFHTTWDPPFRASLNFSTLLLPWLAFLLGLREGEGSKEGEVTVLVLTPLPLSSPSSGTMVQDRRNNNFGVEIGGLWMTLG